MSSVKKDSDYTTDTTKVGDGWYCRVLYRGRPVVQTFVKKRTDIGPALRDLLRTMDKCGGDRFTSAARKRKFRSGNAELSVKHEWLVR